jgi:hypothetical protein
MTSELTADDMVARAMKIVAEFDSPTDCVLVVGDVRYPVHSNVFAKYTPSKFCVAHHGVISGDKLRLTRSRAAHLILALYEPQLVVTATNIAALFKVSNWLPLIREHLVTVITSDDSDIIFKSQLHKLHWMCALKMKGDVVTRQCQKVVAAWADQPPLSASLVSRLSPEVWMTLVQCLGDGVTGRNNGTCGKEKEKNTRVDEVKRLEQENIELRVQSTKSAQASLEMIQQMALNAAAERKAHLDQIETLKKV